MADNSIIALNIGSQRVSMAEFAPGKGGLAMKKFQAVDILADPAGEGTRSAEVRAAVAQLAKALKVKGKIRAAVSGHSVVTKFVKLPPIDSDDLEDLVAMEAQQQIPFPLSEGAWDWAAMESGGIEKEVLLVAIRQEVLDDISESVVGAGLGLKEVDSAPTALFNAFRYNYPDVNEPVLLVDLGAKSTDLIFIEGKRVYIQGVNAPGATGAGLTSAIAKEFGVAFPEAEAHKVGAGMVSLGSTEGLDEGTAALASLIRNSINRLPGEISRRMNFYRSQQGGGAPTKIILAGGGANLGYVSEFLSEKLSLPVEIFNPLRRVSVSDAASGAINNQGHLLGELVGLAVGGAGKGELHIDLVPTMVEAERESARRRPWLIGAAAAVIVGAGAYAVLQGSAASKASKLADEMEERSAELAPYATKIDNWNADTEVISEIGMEYAKAQESRQYWVGLLDELAEYFASDTVWVADFRPWSNYVPGDAGSGKSYVKSGFERLAFGESVVDLKSFDTRNYDGVKGVNAIRIDGFWRAGADGRNHRAVTEILERIKKGVADAEAAAEKKMEETGLEVEPDTHFILMKEDRDEREMVPLSDAEILVENNTTLGEDAYGAPFTIILPLREAKPMTELTKGKSIN